MNFDSKALVMVGSCFINKNICQLLLAVTLNNFLQCCFIIFKNLVLGVIKFFNNKTKNVLTCFFHSGIEIKRRQNRFKSIS